MLFLLIVIFAVYVFEYINGFHDAANAIATVVSTKVMTPRVAVLMAAAFNLLGAPFLEQLWRRRSELALSIPPTSRQ